MPSSDRRLSFILDASVAAKWFNNEDLTDKAIEVRDAFVRGRIRLLAPTQLAYEVANAIWKNRGLTAEDAKKAIQDLMDIEIEMIALDQKLAVDAMKIARDYSITFYDAAYVALAGRFDADLISADTEILAKSKNNVRSLHLKDFRVV